MAPLRAVARRIEPGGMLVVKHFWRAEPPDVPGLVRIRQRRFGETMLTFLQAEES